MPLAASNNRVEEVPKMSINTFRAHATANEFHFRFNGHMRKDVLGRDEGSALDETPPDPYTPARLPQWGLDQDDPAFNIAGRV